MANRASRNAAGLLSSYAASAPYFFSTPRRTVLATSKGVNIEARGPGALIARVEGALSAARARGSAEALVAGAIPFDTSRPCKLALYEKPHSATSISTAGAAFAERCSPLRARRVALQPTPAQYERAVERAVEAIARGELSKVVLSRTLSLETAEPLHVPSLLRRLSGQNPGKYVFACDVGEPSDPATFLGASPELLLEKRGDQVSSHPLAGSRPRSHDPIEDLERADALASCEKSRHEHAVVVAAVRDALAPYCVELDVPSEPELVQTATMWHLGTRVVGRVADPALSSLELALALHPTPAVCGEPMQRSRSTIDELEGFDRSFFTGLVGYCDAQGDGEWAVAIRCALARENAIKLYAGAGIVAGSVARLELDETTAKLNTMLRALGVDHLHQVL